MDIKSKDALQFMLKIKKVTDLKVIDCSMNPTIKPDSSIKVSAFQHLRTGDIIVFQRSSYLVIHRIVKYKKKQLIIKGDNNSYLDVDARKDNIVAKAIRQTRLSPLIAHLSYYKYRLEHKKKIRFIYGFVTWLLKKLCVLENKLLNEIIT